MSVFFIVLTQGFLSNLILVNFGILSRQSFGRNWSLFESSRLKEILIIR